MFEVASQIIICLILAALIGWFIGYLMGKASCRKKNESSKIQMSTADFSLKNEIENNELDKVRELSERVERGEIPTFKKL